MQNIISVKSLPIEIIIHIANNLSYRDILALQRANRHLAAIMIDHFWPQVRQLAICAPLRMFSAANPLNPLLLVENTDSTPTRHFRISDEICNNSLRTLNLHRSPWWIKQHLRFDSFDQLPRFNKLNGPKICRAITQHCGLARLHTLDLSGVKLLEDGNNSHSLLAMARAVGHGVRVLRLRESFREIFDYDTSTMITPSDFDHFLRSFPNLLELDICGNKLNPTSPFSGISNKLQIFKAFFTELNLLQIIEVAQKAPQLEELQFYICNRTDATQQQLDELCNSLPSIQRLWALQFYSPSLQPIRLNFSNATKEQLKSLRIGQTGGSGLLPFVQSLLEQQFPNLRDVHICQGSLPERNSHRFFANLTVLSIFACDAINDDLLERIARYGNMIDLRIICCDNVTWKGLAYFLDFCPNIHSMEAVEQMTDELLEKTMETMDCRIANQKHHQIFKFIRFRLERHFTKPTLWQNSHQNCVQSNSQNMHPGVVYTRRPVQLEVEEAELQEYNQCGCWTTSNWIDIY